METLNGATDAEKSAYAIAMNENRRHLSQEQQRELLKRKKEIAALLRGEGKTQEQVAKVMGIAQNTLSDWEDGTNIGADNGSAPDLRIKIPASENEKIAERLDAGEAAKDIAPDYEVTAKAIENHRVELGWKFWRGFARGVRVSCATREGS